MTSTQKSTAAGEPSGDGRSRRRERTRAALLKAARELLAEGSADADIRTITERAGVGFGSFFNHFPDGKDELWTQAVLEILDRQAEWTMAATAEIASAVEGFAAAFRLTGRVVIERPDLMRPVMHRGLGVVFEQRILRERGQLLLAAGEEAGEFAPMDPQLRLSIIGGGVFAMIQLMLQDAAYRTEASVDDVAVALLRSLGVAGERAGEAVARPLPQTEPFSL